MPGASLVLRSVAKEVGGRPVLRGVSLDVPAGETLALLGPSGAGKTTLLRIIAGLDRPDAGAVTLDGVDASASGPRGRGVGMVFQDLALWPYMTVEEHLGGGALLERFALGGLGRRRPPELSGGEKQRLALARAVSRDPRLVLLDEPFSGLDPLLRRSLGESFDELRRERGFTVVWVSHHLDGAVARASRAALLRDGRIEQAGSWAELRTSPANEWVSAFVSEAVESA
ncbi:MAG TPA: ATP-binding cassette domain-containing protein [Planctomycetota bacterium]